MAAFPMCAGCRAEYEDPARPAFPRPAERLPGLRPAPRAGRRPRPAHRRRPLSRKTAALLRTGRIVAVKGLGGYHLACDAAIRRGGREAEGAQAPRRETARRDGRASLEEARRLAAARSARARSFSARPTRPIVLRRRAPRTAALAAGVAPGSPLVGLMLPYTPLHQLLLGGVRRPAGDDLRQPQRRADGHGRRRAPARPRSARPIADALLRHDRADRRPLRRFRRARPRRGAGGAAPGPRDGPESLRVARGFPRPLLACGAHLKNAFCLGAGDRAWLGPHVGDLETDEACRAFEESVARFSRFVGIEPEAVAHDLHPDYFSTRWAASRRRRRARRRAAPPRPRRRRAWPSTGSTGRRSGVAWDGTGYGGDGTAWGGELLVADSRASGALATLRPIALPGGDAAIRELWRLALALRRRRLRRRGAARPGSAFSTVSTPSGSRSFGRMRSCGLNAPLVHGAGRWFDAFGALIGSAAGLAPRRRGPAALEFARPPRTARELDFHFDRSRSHGRTARRPRRTFALPCAPPSPTSSAASRRPSSPPASTRPWPRWPTGWSRSPLRETGPLPVVLDRRLFQNRRLLGDVRDGGRADARRVFTAARSRRTTAASRSARP